MSIVLPIFLLNVVHYGLCEMVNTLYKIQDSENHNLLRDWSKSMGGGGGGPEQRGGGS